MQNINPPRRIIPGLVLATWIAVMVNTCDAQSPRPNQMPDEHLQVMLVKNALIALNHANVTGNYAVLRDLCSPRVREDLTAADFAYLFRDSHDRTRDMSFVMEMKPILAQRPTMSSDGRLRLVGYFPTRPSQLHYEIVFLASAQNDWWIERILVRTEPAGSLQ